MPVNDALYGRQADSSAFIFVDTMQPLKRTKQLVGIGHIKSRAVIAYRINVTPVLRHGSDLDACRVGSAREFPGIPQQIFECDPDQMFVPFNTHPGGDDDVSWRTGSDAQIVNDGLDDPGEIYVFPVHVTAADAR